MAVLWHFSDREVHLATSMHPESTKISLSDWTGTSMWQEDTRCFEGILMMFSGMADGFTNATPEYTQGEGAAMFVPHPDL